MFKFKWPFRIIISGSSGSGKSVLLGEILKEREKIIDQKIDRIVYCAKFKTSVPVLLRDDKNIIFHEGLPTEEMIENDSGEKVLFCLDDLLETAFSSDIVSRLYTQGRNRNLSCILITQNLFPRYPNARNISLNANYIIVFRNLRDSSSISHLAKQICPGNSKAFSNIFTNSINRPYSYLLLDFTQSCADVFRYRENILSNSPCVFISDDDLQNAPKWDGTSASLSEHFVEFPEF